MIPKIIHYCWFGGAPLPNSVKECIKSWKEKCPDYEIIEWNESNFDVNSHPFMKAAYEAKAWAFVSDYARLKVVYDNGGFYLDTDVELLKNLDLLCEKHAFFGIQQFDCLVATGLGFGAVKGTPILLELLESYDKVMFSVENKKDLICPELNTRIFEDHGYKREYELQQLGDITIYPPEYFDPVSPCYKKKLISSNTISIHHYSSSWETSTERLKGKIYNFFGKIVGQQVMKKIKSKVKRLIGLA